MFLVFVYKYKPSFNPKSVVKDRRKLDTLISQVLSECRRVMMNLESIVTEGLHYVTGLKLLARTFFVCLFFLVVRKIIELGHGLTIHL